MSTSLVPYQGGMPSIYSRNNTRQRGNGFLSGLKRFLIPLAKSALPHVIGAVGDVIGGRSASDTLKKRGRAAGADLMHTAADTLHQRQSPSSPPPPPRKRIKRRAAPTSSHKTKLSKVWK